MKPFALAIVVAASATAFAHTQNPQSRQSPESQSPQTFTGCLTSAQNIFTLTVADPPIPGATAQNTAFTLKPSGNLDLKSLVNKKVEVKGVPVSTDDSARVVDSTASQATGTAGAANANTAHDTGTVTPRVETTSKAQIVARTLNISAAREVASKCDPIGK